MQSNLDVLQALVEHNFRERCETGIGTIPPAEAEHQYYAAVDNIDMAA